MVLSVDAIAELAGMLAEVDAAVFDASVLEAAGRLHWYRYHELSDGEDQPDLERALVLYGRLHDVSPEVLPEQMRAVIDENPLPDFEYRKILQDETVWIFDWALRAQEEALRAAAVDTLVRLLDMHGREVAELVSHTTVGNLCRTFFEETSQLTVLDEAVHHLRIAVTAAADADQKSAALINLADALHSRFIHTSRRPDLDEAITLARDAITVANPTAAHHSAILHNLALILVTAYEEVGVAEYLTDSVGLLRRAVELDQAPTHMSSLAHSLRLMHERTKLDDHLDEAVTVARESVQLSASDGVGRAVCLSRLAQALQARFESAGVIADLDEAVECHRQVVATLPEDHVFMVPSLSNLSGVLQQRFESVGARDDLGEAVRANRQALALSSPDHANRAAVLANLGVALHTLHTSSGSARDLDEAVEVGQRAIDATPEGHPDLPSRLTNLSVALEDRFQRAGSMADLERAAWSARCAVEVASPDHPQRPGLLSNLGNVLQARYVRTGIESDLNEAVESLTSAVEATPVDHSDYVRYAVNLGLALRSRFERRGQMADLDEAVERLEAGMRAAPATFLWRPAVVSNLGIALQSRFERTGSAVDLDRAISLLREAAGSMDLLSADSDTVLTNLSDALQSRYSILGSLSDLEEAVSVGRQVLDVVPEEHPNRSGRLSNLGNALCALYERARRASDLDQAVALLSEAVASAPDDDPARVGHLTNLGAVLLTRAVEGSSTSALTDMDDAVRAFRDAVDSCPDDHGTRYSIVLSNLGAAMVEKLKLMQDGHGAGEVIEFCRRAVASIPLDHPNRARALSGLGEALDIDYRINGHERARAEAILVLGEALLARTAVPVLRVEAGRLAGGLAAVAADWAGAISLYSQSVELLAGVAPRGIGRLDQEFRLIGLDGIASEAASAALQLGATERAAELLEHGRVVIFSQALDAWTDMTELTVRHPELARRLVVLRDQLNQFAGELIG